MSQLFFEKQSKWKIFIEKSIQFFLKKVDFFRENFRFFQKCCIDFSMKIFHFFCILKIFGKKVEKFSTKKIRQEKNNIF